MRKLRCIQAPGASVQEVLDEFNERAEEFGISSESDIVSVSAMPATGSTIPLHNQTANVEVVIVFWADL